VIAAADTTITVQTEGNVRTIAVLDINEKKPNLFFTDTLYNLETDYFYRDLANGTMISYSKGKLAKIHHNVRKAAYMETLPLAQEYNFSAITLDLETSKLPDNTLQVISAAVFDGTTFSTYFLNDFASSDEMLLEMIADLRMNTENNGRRSLSVYIHNFSGFDGIFMMRLLASYCDKFDITMRDRNIITLRVSPLEKYEFDS
jgi:hypothetical protein